jgi:hypothetical protein
LKRSTHRLAKVLIWSVAAVLMVYVTLDTIYFHVFFAVGNALVPGLILSLILIVGIALLLFIQLREKPMQGKTNELLL